MGIYDGHKYTQNVITVPRKYFPFSSAMFEDEQIVLQEQRLSSWAQKKISIKLLLKGYRINVPHFPFFEMAYKQM